MTTKTLRTFLLPDDLHAQLRAEAERLGLTMTAVLIIALRDRYADKNVEVAE